MSETLVKAEGVSKKFSTNTRKSMRYGIQDIVQSAFGIIPKTDTLRPSEFWALDDVSFELRRGECLGLIGKNGSGKSTFLKILNGIISPDKGRVEIKGKIGALIEIGAGFHPMLTGRENVYVNASIFGFSKSETDKKFDEIVDFAEIEDFIDTPIRHYSSGMRVRLGFAIAAQMRTDVFLIDEVLAVGDAGFKAKCFNAITEISKNAAVIFVSHSMPLIGRVTSKILLLKNGKSIYKGDSVPKGIEKYQQEFLSEKRCEVGGEKAKIQSFKLFANGHPKDKIPFSIQYKDELRIEIEVSMQKDIKKCAIFVNFFDRDLNGVAQCASIQSKFFIHNLNAVNKTQIVVPELLLNNGSYCVTFGLMEVIGEDKLGESLHEIHAACDISVSGAYSGFTPIQFNAMYHQIS